MLRRTPPRQVLPVYTTFVRRFPTPQTLAAADAQQLETLLAPLGLRWRARNIIEAAAEMNALSKRELCESEHLVKLTGVGDYVAGAVAIMTKNEPHAIIDTNIIRVLGRYWRVPVTAESRRQRAFRRLAATCVPSKDPKVYTLALLDIGALLCRPRDPFCSACPLQSECRYARRHRDRRGGTAKTRGRQPRT
jgi:A/G-specific adenine glycosylase